MRDRRTIYSSKSFAKDKENFKIENLVGTKEEVQHPRPDTQTEENQKGGGEGEKGEQQYNTTVTPR